VVSELRELRGFPRLLGRYFNTLILVLGVLTITVFGGILIALLIDRPIWGQGPVRILSSRRSSSCRPSQR
jgi:ABC-type sugar transport system permease subunit